MQPLRPGSIFGDRYEILERLADGGMGQVYRALHLPLCREVALKLLQAHASADFAARFEREAHATARLDHPHCVRIVDTGRASERQYIAMELLHGPTLAAALLDERALAVPRAIQIARNLLGALDHAHRLGVLHRDIKPDNVMLVTRGAVIIDFGLACLRDESPVTQIGMCVGSPSYIAPERLLGRPYDARADLYAVGVILYEMLGGSRPFVGASPEEIMQRALARPPRPLRALRDDVPPALDAVVLRALAKDPARRFESAGEMLVALDEARLAGRGVTGVDEAAASTMIQLAFTQPSLRARLWSWLRYGPWRWRRA